MIIQTEITFSPLINRRRRVLLFYIQSRSCSLFLCCTNCIDNAVQCICIGAYRVAHCKDKEGKPKLLEMDLSECCAAFETMCWINKIVLLAHSPNEWTSSPRLKDDRCLITHQRVLYCEAGTDTRRADHESLIYDCREWNPCDLLMPIITNQLTVTVSAE